MNKKFIIWGATGLAKVLWELLSYENGQVVALFDNNPNIKELSPSKKAPIYYGREGFFEWKNTGILDKDEIYGLVAVGGAHGKDRLELQNFLEQNGIKPYSAIHPRSFVAKDASIGSGCQILANAVVASEAVLGNSCIVNTSASVDHESILGNGVHAAPGAKIAGLVRIGDFSLIGIGATISARVTIGRNVEIDTGVVVTENVPDDTHVHRK